MLQQMNLTTKGEKIDLLKHKCFNSRGSAKQCRVAQRSPQELFYDKNGEMCGGSGGRNQHGFLTMKQWGAYLQHSNVKGSIMHLTLQWILLLDRLQS